jgi:isocitrate dehydrogenase
MPPAEFGTKLAALAGPEFELRIVSARGTVVWPKMSPAFDHPGFFRSRFVARDTSKVVSDEALFALIARVAGVATWFHLEKLRSWNGEEGFTRAQGE